jgi:hypothetical protein
MVKGLDLFRQYFASHSGQFVLIGGTAATLAPGAHLTPIPIDEAVASLSAILMDEDYYDFVISGRRNVDGLP